MIQTVARAHADVDHLISTVVEERLWPSRTALRRYLQWLFDGVPIEGRRVLDVGGGTGVFSHYLAAMGAASSTCLEPEADGGDDTMNERFTHLQDSTGIDNVTLVPWTFQAFEAPPGSFDLVLLHNSINHLDEEATIRLPDDARSRDTYGMLFGKIASLLSPGGHVLITDCARTNLFPLLGMRHPISRSIEWHKHQDPGVWTALLREAGFVEPSVSWSSYNSLGALGWTLLANRVGAFFVTGHFRLLMRKGPRPA
jgi:2-polyprenyl-3-methyl-5-hydroxy-6-metoxy-1,4-benzoquinol methylase